MKILIEHKAEVNAQTKDGQTALSIATSQGNVQILQLLLDAKADVNLAKNNGVSLLHISGEIEIWIFCVYQFEKYIVHILTNILKVIHKLQIFTCMEIY